MKGQNVGYIRVSSIQQNTDRQLVDIELDRIFEDKKSGRDTNRPQLKACLEHLREGDTLHVHSIDRLARNLLDLQKIVATLVGKGVSVHFHKENLIFNNSANPMQALTMQIMGAFAEFQRSLIREAQAEGIVVALEKGVKFGAPAKLSPERVDELKAKVVAGGNKAQIAKEFGITRPTLYKLIR